MITVTVEGIKDYQVCSLYHKYKHIDEIRVPVSGRRIMYDRYNNTMRKIISFFFYRKQSGVIPSFNSIANRWQKLWFPEAYDAYDIKVEQHSTNSGNMASYSTKAITILKELYDVFSDDDIEPLLIYEPFTIPVENNIILEGTFDLVYRQNGVHHVVLFNTMRSKSQSSLDMELSSLKVAYEQRVAPNVSVVYETFDLTPDRASLRRVPDEVLRPSMVKYWSNQVYSGEHIPRRGYTAYCKGCPYDDMCKKFWEESV